MSKMPKIRITCPDDWHVHLRQDDLLATTVPLMAPFARAVVMPNTKPPMTSQMQAEDYKAQIMQHCAPGQTFEPLMTLYLTPALKPKMLENAKKKGIVGCKYYPQNATTHSEYGFSNLKEAYPLFEAMQHEELVLQIHAEANAPDIDIFDKEDVFIETHLNDLIADFPKLRIVIEHISKASTATFVKNAPSHVAATITAHHLWLNRNDLLNTKVHPHHFCLPVLKRRQDQEALLQAAISGSKKFFFGSDSAPHLINQKETACGCAGIFSSPVALPILAMLFETHQALDKLEGFTSLFGADFYQLPQNKSHITLVKQPWQVPNSYASKQGSIVPLACGQQLTWIVQ
jgi:dihydroorotase